MQTQQRLTNMRTLAASYYTSDEVLTQEKRNLFFKTWQFVCHASELAEAGSYKTMTIFDQNIMLVRTQEGDLRGYFNVCPHRGHMLVEGSGQKRAFTCPYHAWTFGLKGDLLGVCGVNTYSSLVWIAPKSASSRCVWNNCSILSLSIWTQMRSPLPNLPPAWSSNY